MEKSNEAQAEFKPFVSADKVMPEFTATSIILGILLAVMFGAANAYLGLKVGMTVSASIPAAVLSMGIIRVILKKESILENNMVQTIGSAGESLAAGAIFTLPAVFMWADEGVGKVPSYWAIALVAICGGFLGIVFMIPLRKALIVKEHGTLPYPEGTACSEVLMAGEQGGSASSTVFKGLGIASLYKIVADGLKLFPSQLNYTFKNIKGAGFGMEALPALAGVGYICGARISSYVFSGGLTAWFVLMPLIKQFGGDMVIFPSGDPISEMGTWEIWGNYIKYIGAGVVAGGGIISLIKSTPLIVRTFADSMKSLKNGSGDIKIDRTQEDMKPAGVLCLLVIALLIILVSPSIPLGFMGALLIIVFGFFFATVSSRMVGLVGSSNNPISGMAIATLLFSSLILKKTQGTGPDAMVAAIFIGTIICIIAAMAGDMSQDLKTGYIVGATPKKQQIGEIIGVLSSGLTIAGVLYLLNAAWGYGSTELPTPQASLMKMIVEGVMGGNLPWGLVFTGIFISIIVEILGIPVLPFAIGMYLPVHVSAGLMAGGVIRIIVDHKRGYRDEAHREAAVTSGVLYSSGMIAGEGLVGILLAVFALIPKKGFDNFGAFIDMSARGVSLPMAGTIVIFLLLLASVLKISAGNKNL